MQKQKKSAIDKNSHLQEIIQKCSGRFRNDNTNKRYIEHIPKNMPSIYTIKELKKRNRFLRDTLQILKEKLDELNRIERLVYKQKQSISIYMSLNYHFEVTPQEIDKIYGLEDWEIPQDPHQYDHIDLPKYNR